MTQPTRKHASCPARWLKALSLIAIFAAITTAQAQSGSRQPAGSDPLAHFNTSGLTLPRNQIRSGGPAKDGIPSLSSPKTTTLAQANFAPDDRMIVVTIDNNSRAYPINVLNWHEAINDTLANLPIAVIYCPLCDSVSVVERRIGDKTFTFGISGLLHNSNVLLYDRTDNALWSQVGLQAVSGPHAGKSLKHLPWKITSFKQLKTSDPNATVVSTQTGHQRDYAQNPYTRYFTNDRLMFPLSRKDDRLKPKQPVIGVQVGDLTRAYPIETIVKAGGNITDTLGDQTIRLQADDKGTVTILQAPIQAKAIHTFWFAWAAFHPRTDLYTAPAHP